MKYPTEGVNEKLSNCSFVFRVFCAKTAEAGKDFRPWVVWAEAPDTATAKRAAIKFSSFVFIA
ncbi:hypothetical protein LN893_20035 [Pontibacter sp. XAAS-A31]|nr:hypothetical protein [Pontibacter harenae]